MKDFSIILPSRGDKDNVKKMLDSIERTTTNKDAIEVLFAIDEGKTDIRNFVRGQDYSYDIYFYERPKTRNFSQDYYNWLANRSCGCNVWGFNDDAWIATDGWDSIIKKKIKETGWSVYLVDTHDTTKSHPGNYFCTFPMVSRRSIGIMGYFLHPRVRMYPADQVIFDTFKAVQRIIDANEIIVQHDHIVEVDASKSLMMEVLYEDRELWKKDPIDVRNEIIRLMRVGEKDYKPSKLKRIINILQED
jgi:glycosyltransferase involved in cell wall biosynthesis